MEKNIEEKSSKHDGWQYLTFVKSMKENLGDNMHMVIGGEFPMSIQEMLGDLISVHEAQEMGL